MRVAIFTEAYLPSVNGVVTHVKTLKEGLEQLGHKVLIVTADSRVKKHTTNNDIMYCPAIKLKKIYNYDVASPISIERLKLIKEFNPDIIHIHNEFGIGFSGMMFSKMLKIPLVYTMHTMYDDYVYYIANRHFCKFVTNATHKYAKYLASAASALTGPSKKIEEYFKKCGVKKPVSVIPNSVEVSTFCRDSIDKEKIDEIRKKYGFSSDELIFCFCGRMGQEKNIDLLLRLWAEKVKPDDGMKLLLLGGGPQLEEYEALANTLGLGDLVKFTGRIEHADIPPYYAACDIYTTASLTECHSISMMEGMSTGMPVLSIRDELNSDQIVEGVSGYFFDGADDMYMYMQKFKAMSKEELDAFKQSARDSIVSSGAEALAEHILGIYLSVIEEYKQKAMLRQVSKHSLVKHYTEKLEREEKQQNRKQLVKVKRIKKALKKAKKEKTRKEGKRKK